MTITGVSLKARYRQSTTTYKTSYCCFFFACKKAQEFGFCLTAPFQELRPITPSAAAYGKSY